MTQTRKQQLRQAIAADPALDAVAQRYAVSVTEEVLDVIAGDPEGAVARQYVPDARELVSTPGELEDPIGDERHSPVKGIVHRYPDRVLLKPVHVCAVYCRFCFRREQVGPGSELLAEEELDKAIDYIRNAPKVWEVILTGGDPFVLSPRRLKDIIARLSAIEHIKIIRLHTRVPVANPLRVTDELVAALDSPKAVYCVLHANHASELTDKVVAATQKLVRAGIPLLSQSTLLRGINDDAVVLENLFRRLTEIKVKPYYLHHPDLAPGTSHFRLPLHRGQELMRNIWGRISGLCQPRYVLDIPQGYGKVPVSQSYIQKTEDGYDVEDYQGTLQRYQDQ